MAVVISSPPIGKTCAKAHNRITASEIHSGVLATCCMSAAQPTKVANSATVVAARKPNLRAAQKTNMNKRPSSGLVLPGGSTWGRYTIMKLTEAKQSARTAPSVRVGLNGRLAGGD